ncbi:Ldh family oxidoreductase [Pelosinus propionicus]|uniref:Malate/lactate/ureidoglycolate dehydrogenase, LDH2 family n=1 Tax=Pelosinus propionicus DSM 13327 TaxID=1123291 RepID=A0A1I4GYY9_9FIRM|nr:Ldh family oxidoreductase [Pelosinus propionicus]SFL35189.1 Malate/lactate/ureidoglycolate dehydrogenase, LDH2 family [Pelosinus propionicus DSM 13327]
MSSEQNIFSVSSLHQFIVQVLIKAGVPAADGKIVADNLLKADLWGVGTHGVSRFPRYLMRIKDGSINSQPNITINKLWPALFAVDGDNGLGSVVAAKAMEAAMDAAEDFGLCAVGVRSSNHFGTAGFYCDMAAKRNYLSIVFTNALSAIPPWGGKEAYLGTNPIAIGFPRLEKNPVIIDLATSIVARGKIITAAKQGLTIPEGWALDKNGRPTTNAEEALLGMILPMAGPKGYALALAVDHLSGVLTGAAFGQDVASYQGTHNQADVGHLIIVIKVDGFISKDDYYKRTDKFCEEIKAVEKAAGVSEIYLPGEREQTLEQQLLLKGIEIPKELLEELKEISSEYGVPLVKA